MTDSTPDDPQRVVELAREAAERRHVDARRDALHHGVAWSHGHINECRNCPHDDCVLVRSASSNQPALELARALVTTWRERYFEHIADTEDGRAHEVRRCADDLDAVLVRAASVQPTGVCCLDCGMPYGGEDWLDTHLSRSQWLEIHPDEGGVLCANCIVKRAAKIPGAVLVHLVIELAASVQPMQEKP